VRTLRQRGLASFARPQGISGFGLGCWLAVGFLVGTAHASGPDPIGRALGDIAAQVAREKAALDPAQRKVDSRIRRDAWPGTTPQRRLASPLVAARDGSWRGEGRVHVIVRVAAPASAQVAALEAAGLETEVVSDRFGLVQGWIADGAVPALAALGSVRSVAPAWPARHGIGTVTSEGDHASRADLVRPLGHDGTGVTVGVISDGIDSLAASRASGDLPAVTVPPRCRRGNGDEGTAMLEIVHDLAPGASLRFSGPRTSLEMITAIDCLAAAGAKVIVDDLIFLGEPFFEDGPIALAAADAVAGGVSYHTAAGNFGDGEYLVEDYRPGVSNFHDFDAGVDQDALNRVVLRPGETLNCFLQWTDPFGTSSNDYDLYVIEPSSVTVLDQSTTPQTGTQDPFEAVAIQNRLASNQVVALLIQKFAGEPRTLKLLCPGTPLQYRSSQFGISGHAARPEVMTVAAIDALDPGLDDTEAFTSQGPAPIFFPQAVTRPKPDVAAFDGVTTTAPGFAPFFGTSAAAPHAAAVAALLLSANPALSPGGVQSLITSTAADIGAPGFDLVSGHGRLDALAALDALGELTSTTTTTPITTTTSGPVTTVPVTSTSIVTTSTTTTTLPACDPDDCDGNPCTIGDSCAGGACQPGTPLTPGLLAGLVRESTNAVTECGGAPGKLLRKVLRPLVRVERVLAQADGATREPKRRRKLTQARRTVGQAARKLAATGGRLPPPCRAALDDVMAGAAGGLSCLP
jgi:subtilisin family serine protease